MRGHHRKQRGRYPALILLVAAAAAACSERNAILEPAGEVPQASTGTQARKAGPAIVQVDPGFDFVVDGPAHPVAVTVHNGGSSTLTETFVTLTLRQDRSTRSLGSAEVVCSGAPAGVFPAGATCSMTVQAVLSSTGGEGTIVGGAGTLEVALRRTMKKRSKLLDTFDAAVTVTVPPPPAITDFYLDSETLELEGSAVGYNIEISNDGPERTGISVAARLEQGAVVRAAGSVATQCVVGPGVLPTGGCGFDYYVSASNLSEGTGTLIPGPVTLVIEVREGTTVLDSWSGTVTLAALGSGALLGR
ncbi:MAG TPA: hypothetical protein VK933_03545 [Longimicrobiales bacterium]|nr:hypothetical protein [Longimicrobiales bacterium]